MEDGCIHNQVSHHCDKYGHFCNGTAKQKAKCPEWGMVKAFEDSMVSITMTIPKFRINEDVFYENASE